jgi:hypothetical protein
VSQETSNRTFDELARGLASGSISRGRALRLMGAALVGGTLASVGIGGVAAADPPGCKRNGKHCKKNEQCCSERCASGVCAEPCPSDSVLLSNGTCATSCGTEIGECDFCGGLCVIANSQAVGGLCSSGIVSQTFCETDDQCPLGEFCSREDCVSAC